MKRSLVFTLSRGLAARASAFTTRRFRIVLATRIVLVGLLLVLAGSLGLSQAQEAAFPGREGEEGVSAPPPASPPFTYQGQLKRGGNPVNGACDFQFSLWDAAGNGSPPTGGTQIGGTQTKSSVSVTAGLFTVQLNFGDGAFNGDDRWLQIAVRCPAGGGDYTTLSPRQALTPAPYALALPGLWTRTNSTSPNVIGGYTGNLVTTDVVGAAISGGGHSSGINRVTDDYGTVGGGDSNRAGDNAGSTADVPYATVGGGKANVAGGAYSTVSGGSGNTTSGAFATVGGGSSNTAGGMYAVVSGGNRNTASGTKATVPGGDLNEAKGTYSFAAGRRAKANHDGSFVWADRTDADFASTGNDQFLLTLVD